MDTLLKFKIVERLIDLVFFMACVSWCGRIYWNGKNSSEVDDLFRNSVPVENSFTVYGDCEKVDHYEVKND